MRSSVRAAARSVARCTESMRVRADSSTSRSSWSSSTCPRMTESTLLKSCAMPPANRPTDSIFCACSSCCWRALRSVTSRSTMTTSSGVPSWRRSRCSVISTHTLSPRAFTRRDSGGSCASDPTAAERDSSCSPLSSARSDRRVVPTSRWSGWPSRSHSARLVSTMRPSSVATAIATGESWKVRRNRSVAAHRPASAASRSSRARARASAASRVRATYVWSTTTASVGSVSAVKGPVVRAAAQLATPTITSAASATPRGPNRSAAHPRTRAAEKARGSSHRPSANALTTTTARESAAASTRPPRCRAAVARFDQRECRRAHEHHAEPAGERALPRGAPEVGGRQVAGDRHREGVDGGAEGGTDGGGDDEREQLLDAREVEAPARVPAEQQRRGCRRGDRRHRPPDREPGAEMVGHRDRAHGEHARGERTRPP